jgi:hypothetical protein
MDNLYEYIDKWNGNELFMYVVIFIIILWYFSRKSLGTNILIGIIVGYFVICYLNTRNVRTDNTRREIQQAKKESINPKLKKTDGYDDVVNLIFSIQDMYPSNPQQYAEAIKSINVFYELYKEVQVDKKTSYINYGLMKQFKRDTLNALMSITYGLPSDKRVQDKLNNATIVLDEIMTKHLDQISYFADDYTYRHGYNVDTKIIDYGPKASNEYDDIFKPYSYEIF